MTEHGRQELAEWARAIRASDHEAFASLYEATHSALLRYAWTLIQDEDAGYDVLQEAYMKLWGMRRRIDPTRSLEALLFRIVRNIAYKRYRRRRHQLQLLRPLEEEAVASPITEEVHADMLAGRVKQWVAAMPPRRREVFELSRTSGLSHQEIAELLGVSPKTVNNHLVAALRELRDRLNAYNADQASS